MRFILERATNEVLHTLNLADFLAKYSDKIDVTKQEVLIPIRVEFKNANIIVSIGDWVVEEVIPGFGEGDKDNDSDDVSNS